MIYYYENANYSNDSEESADDMANSQYHTSNQQINLENVEDEVEIKRFADLRKIFPSRNDFQFENGIKISSDFDSGNLMDCDELREDQTY